jgi:MiaB/RimO family radical SAM methylthiotransferase
MMYRRWQLHRRFTTKRVDVIARVQQDNLRLADFVVSSNKEVQVPEPVLSTSSTTGPNSKRLRFHIETYGCQMNLSDSEIVRSILEKAGYANSNDIAQADIILTNTCAVRENAEDKVWNRLSYFQSIRNKNKVKGQRTQYPIVGVLGCMAERLKEKLLGKDSVDFVCGPDAYRDVPRLLESVTSVGQKAANTQLSFEETYADINPVREVGDHSAFVSIMRGCNNMCSFCIVPFTRGRERSRGFSSIMQEIQQLVDKGVKEIVLLGQNVNGYHDASEESAAMFPTTEYKSAPGFNNLYKSKKRHLPGARFSDLLAAIAEKHSDVRLRFTSPHPKDFPVDVLQAVATFPNICPALHLPVQSGSSTVLERMRRGYTREAYLALVNQVRALIPRVKISTDVICGFCLESEQEHEDTVSLMKEVRFDQAFMYAYSLREKTHAARSETLSDDVPESVKQRRLREVIDTYHMQLRAKNVEEEQGRLRLVLVEGYSTR